MSGKTEKRFRRLARQTYRYHYEEFLDDVKKLKFSDRLRQKTGPRRIRGRIV
ncbi:MAG: hypothetical protein ACW98X_27750 [Promethearchaeota archaeon]